MNFWLRSANMHCGLTPPGAVIVKVLTVPGLLPLVRAPQCLEAEARRTAGEVPSEPKEGCHRESHQKEKLRWAFPPTKCASL